MGDWKDALFLEKDETILDSRECNNLWYYRSGSAKGGLLSWDDIKTEPGIFVLTNMRIIFIKKEGTFSKSYHVKYTIPIEEVQSVSLDYKHRKSVSISYANKTAIFDIRDIGDELALNPLRDLIRKQVSARKEQLVGAGTTKAEVVKEKEVLIKIRCPYCKNTYDETLDKCPHCGGHI